MERERSRETKDSITPHCRSPADQVHDVLAERLEGMHISFSVKKIDPIEHDKLKPGTAQITSAIIGIISIEG